MSFFFYCFPILYFIYFYSIFFFSSAKLGLHFFFFQFLEVQSYLVNLRSFFFLNAYVYFYKLPFQYCFAYIPKVWVCFVFVCFKIFFNFLFYFYLTQQLFKYVLFNFHIFVNFPVFFLLLIPTFIPLISIFLKFLRPILWFPSMVSFNSEHIQENCFKISLQKAQCLGFLRTISIHLC